jgi:hypothetical protein
MWRGQRGNFTKRSGIERDAGDLFAFCVGAAEWVYAYGSEGNVTRKVRQRGRLVVGGTRLDFWNDACLPHSLLA